MSKKKDMCSIGGGITQIKMTGDICWDIDKVYDAANWVSSMADFLVEEMQVHNFDTELFVNAMNVQKLANQLASSSQKMRWRKMEKYGEL